MGWKEKLKWPFLSQQNVTSSPFIRQPVISRDIKFPPPIPVAATFHGVESPIISALPVPFGSCGDLQQKRLIVCNCQGRFSNLIWNTFTPPDDLLLRHKVVILPLCSSPFARDRLDPTHGPLPEPWCQVGEMKATPFFMSSCEWLVSRWLRGQLLCPFYRHLQHFMRCLNLGRHLTPANGFASQPINWLFTAGMSQNCRVKFSYPYVFCSEEHINPLLPFAA